MSQMEGAGSLDDGSGSLTISSMVKEIQGLKDKFKREDVDSPSPFADLEKATVLQECRAFSDSKIVTENPRKCSQLITKLLHIVTQGDEMSSSEVTDVFFGVTKLFQSKDASLRRMVYFFIKEVAETCNPDDIIIATSSLTKDMNSNEDLFRANSIRVLAKMIDSTMLGAIERYVKQAIVDKNAMVSSSALVAGSHLIKQGSSDVVRRWVNEVQEAVLSPSDMVQFHALSLLYDIKQHDRLAISKMVTQLTRGSVTSPMACCLLIRYIAAILQSSANDGGFASSQAGRHVYQHLELMLRHRSEAVIYEAAKALCSLPGVEDRDLGPAVAVLQLFLSSPKQTMRLAAMRALAKVAVAKPSAVVKCNDDMESLISDPNRSIATFAITILLKTGSEASVDRLMKQISSFMNEIADEFKIVVVTAIRELCLKYPLKHRVLVGFLANFLREEGGFEFKKAIVDAVVALMRAIPETKESSLFYLCEFIEDCEFTALSTQILHLVGAHGPTASAPARYIRFVYNRVILENAVVRAAAVTALSKFAAQIPTLKISVSVLLRRSLRDDDDEVRDRATVALRLLGQSVDEDDVASDEDDDDGLGGEEKTAYFSEELLVRPMVGAGSFSKILRSLQKFDTMHGLEASDLVLSYDTLPVVEDAPVATARRQHASSSSISAPQDDSAAELYKIPELAALGRVFRSTRPVELTESETEYVVLCTKHIMQDSIILQFSITNTIPDQLLVDASIALEPVDDNYSIDLVIPAAKVFCGVKASTWIVLKREEDEDIPIASPAQFGAELKFRVVDVDPATGEIEGDEDGFAEDYPIEDVEINTSDFVAKASSGVDFKRSWEENKAGEILAKFALQFKNMDAAITAVVACLGMQPEDGTQIVDDSKPNGPHLLHLSGIFVDNSRVYARAQLAFDDSANCILKISVRSPNKELSQLIADCIK